MFNQLNNNRGIALLSVMVIMSVLMIVGSIMLTMASSESRIVYDYGNNIRAISLADSGADLAIKEWANYISSLDRDSENPDLLGEKANIDSFKTELENAGDNLVQNYFRNNNYYNNPEVYINYTEYEYSEYQPDSNQLDYSAPSDNNILQIKIEGIYEDAVYDYKVDLWYTAEGKTGSHKGEGAVDTEEEPGPELTVAQTNPEDGEENVPIDKIVTITFNESILPGDSFDKIRLEDADGNQIAISTSINGSVLTINPSDNLDYFTEYTVIIPADAVKNTAGNTLSSMESFSFTTKQSSGGGSGGYEPGDYVLYTNSTIFNNNATVTGNVLIGNGTNTVYIHNNSEFFGNVFVNTNLTVSNNACFGKPNQPVQLSVKKSVTFHNNIDIFGDLFYEGNLIVNNHLNVTGQKQQKTVNNPQVDLPALKTEQWYADNSYTIVANNSWPWVELEDNGKYFFKTSYAFNNNTGVNDVIMAFTGDITFHNHFTGSGIIFAPNGTVTFNNGCDFTGFIISKAAVFHNSIELTYAPYTNLPYEAD